ncbi:MAG TPA: Na+/H+ antiporter NhaA [Gammaproteobacteria bacterium]|nr:Na+/H+ antiporter NhaA [Gammaproteobacteria bacterium]
MPSSHDDDHDQLMSGTSAGYEAPWERAFNRVLSPFEEFIRNQAAGGVVLLFSALCALALANSPVFHAYETVLHTQLALRIGPWELSKSLHHWINDGLMTLFFFLVGLEIKGEVLVGSLATVRQAALPAIAAVGGVLVPALIYAVMNPAGIAARGWGIPMATDIAFAVGALVLLGGRVPKGLMTFLVALAIVDDLIAVLVIALFYTEKISVLYLIIAALLYVVLITFNRGGIRAPLPYFVVGTLLWLAMLKSGVHATIAGVLLATAIPARPSYDPDRFSGHVRELMDRFDQWGEGKKSILASAGKHSILQTLENGVHLVETPLQRLEHTLQRPVALLIMPIFALANAGVALEGGHLGDLLSDPVVLGVTVALVAGKFIGISGFSWLALRLGIGQLPRGTTFQHLIGVGLLGGIGFTMSIFISELAFGGSPHNLMAAKTGILAASVIAGTLGFFWLRYVGRKRPHQH